MKIDPRLKDFANSRQAEYIDAINETGSTRAAARKLGVGHASVDSAIRTARKHAASQGYAPGHFDSGVAPGFKMGKVTIQRGPSGVERVWERQSPDAAQLRESLEEFCRFLTEDARGLSPLVAPPGHSETDLLAL